MATAEDARDEGAPPADATTDPTPPPRRAETALAGPEGSAYEAEGPRKRRPRSLWRRLRGWVSRTVVSAVAWAFPLAYMGYCWFVWKTSKVEDDLMPTLTGLAERHGAFVALLWHQEVFTVAYAYRDLHPSTLASTGNFGRIITRMLERCNFEVFRGGSSSAKSRRRRVLPSMIAHMKRNPRVVYGITVDGSKGPAYRLKPGGLLIARACRAPVAVVRAWYSRRILLNTWDRTAIPLPFGRIKLTAIGPYWIPPDTRADELERIRLHLEAELHDLAERSFRVVDPRGDRSLFPPEFTPRWADDQWGIPYGPHDLRIDDPPAWVRRAGDAPEAVDDEDEDEEQGEEQGEEGPAPAEPEGG